MTTASEDTRTPRGVSPLSAEQYAELLSWADYVLRLSDGTRSGTWYVWSEEGQMYGRRLCWTRDNRVSVDDLEMLLDDDVTTQLVVRDNDDSE